MPSVTGPRFLNVLARMFALKGADQSPRTISSDAVPIVMLADASRQAEWQALQGDRHFGAYSLIIAGAGVFPRIALSIPTTADRNLLVMPYRLALLSPNAGESLVDVHPTVPAGAAGNAQFSLTDTRVGQVTTHWGQQASIRSETGAALGRTGAIWRPRLLANVWQTTDLPPIVLTSGWSLMVEHAVLNSEIDIQVWWRERNADPQELRL